MEQLSKLIAGLSIKQRIAIVTAAVLVACAMFAFVQWRREAGFRPLYTAMAPEDAATVVQKLRESGVEYRLADNGATVLVTAEKLAESRLTLAAAGLPKTGRIGFELFDKTTFGATEFVEHINYQRALEGELERSVISLAEVEQARVHVTLQKDGVYLDQQQPAKASVMVKLRQGRRISPQNVQALTHLVASAVEGLSPDSVSILDMDGNLLSRPKRATATDGTEITSETLEMRQQIEHTLIAKINETLEPLLGPNQFRAGASVDCDLTSGEQQEETLDPTHSVMLSSQKTEDVNDRGTAAGGVPGTASNLPAPPARAGNGTGGVSRRTENVTYQTSRIVKHTKIPQGVVKHMSLAVLVGQTVRWEGDGAARRRVLVPPPPETLKTIRDLVAGVTGFQADRGDQLVVETLPFDATLREEPPPSVNKPVTSKPLTQTVPLPKWLEPFRNYIAPAAIGVILLLGLGGVFLKKKFGKKKQVLVVSEAGGELEAGTDGQQLSNGMGGSMAALSEPSMESHGDLAERIRDLAKRDTNVTANVVRMWLQEQEVER